jgi:rubrerythrin
MPMNEVESFLAHAVQLEREAARRYEELTAMMASAGERELQAFFAAMAGFSRMHLKQAMQRAGFREIPRLAAHEWRWPDGLSPETADWVGVDAQMDNRAALTVALDSERRGHAYYAAIAAITTDREVKALADEFAAEEAEHVAELEKWLSHTPER